MKILIIEDNADLSANINRYITDYGYVCEQVFNREEARMKILLYEYDCILLDITLPDGSGLKLLDDINESANKCHSGIIIISAKDSLDDRINGIRLGADDYLVKPFDLSELSVRIFSVIRRRQYSGRNNVEYGDLRIDTLTRKVYIKENEVPHLSSKEYDLLMFFLSSPRRVITKETLAEHLYGDNADVFDNFNCIYAHVKKLKNKLKEAGSEKYIHSVYGVGYKFEE